VNWKRAVNDALTRTTGLELRRATPAAPGKGAGAARRRAVGKPRAGDRLVQAPVFVMCTLRSGSTLLRVMLDTHSQLHAPHELHLRYVSVHLDEKWSERSMKEMGLDERSLQYLLWDRILYRELASSGKPTIVDKTPNNVFIADRIKECWPDARLLFLLRNPAAIARSRRNLSQAEEYDHDRNFDLIRRYCEALERARQTYDGHTLRYEDLTADPARVMQGVCAYLGVPWEPAMLDYGQADHGRYRAGLGDWADKIKTGRVQAPEPPPAEVPEALRTISEAWGYVPAPQAPGTPATSAVEASGTTA
jgi:sulfotransferase family protein